MSKTWKDIMIGTIILMLAIAYSMQPFIVREIIPHKHHAQKIPSNTNPSSSHSSGNTVSDSVYGRGIIFTRTAVSIRATVYMTYIGLKSSHPLNGWSCDWYKEGDCRE